MAFKLGDLASKGSRFTPDLSRMYLNAALGERRASKSAHLICLEYGRKKSRRQKPPYEVMELQR
jgi:hypothetical protein